MGMFILYATTGVISGKKRNDIPVVVAQRFDAGGQLKVVPSGKPKTHTGTTDETTLKAAPGVMLSIHLNNTLAGNVTILDKDGEGTNWTLVIPSGRAGGEFYPHCYEFEKELRITLANGADSVVVCFI